MSCPQQSINLRYMAIKPEVTAGTWVEPVDADFDIRFRGIEFALNIPADDENSKFATGDHAEDESIIGAQSGTITAQVKTGWGGAVATVPDWWTAAQACGQTVKDYTTVGRSLVARKTNDCDTYSIAVYDVEMGATPVTTIYKFAGCIGNMVLGADGIGAPWIANFSYQGKIYDIIDGTALDMTSPDTTVAEKLLSGAFSVFGTDKLISSFSFDLGNEINPVMDQSDASGYSHFAITARRPRMSVNPLGVKQATTDVLNQITTESTGVLSLTSDAVPHFTLKVLKGQLLTHAMATREGYVSWDQVYKALKNGTTGSVADSDLEPEDTYELLQGART